MRSYDLHDKLHGITNSMQSLTMLAGEYEDRPKLLSDIAEEIILSLQTIVKELQAVNSGELEGK